MKITIEEEMPHPPPKRVVLELTEDEALALASIMGNKARNDAIREVHNTFFMAGPNKIRLAKISSQAVWNVLNLYYEIPKHLGFK